jgi:flagellar biosynthesis/type III secretory pathway chaperone
LETPLNQIYDVLQQLTGLHRQLLEVVRLERAALIEANLKSIHAITAKKQTLVEGVREAEKQRLRLITELSTLWKRPVKELTLPNIIIEIQGRDLKSADQLRSIFNTLTILIQRITDQNNANRVLIERSLEHIGAMKRNVLGDSTSTANTYTPSGQKSGGAHVSRLFSGEA